MNNKFLVKIYVPLIESSYEVWIPPNKQIRNVINLLVKSIYELSKENYNPDFLPSLYNKKTSEIYNLEEKIIDTNIRNGSELILL